MLNNVNFSGKRNTAIHGLYVDVTATANQKTRDAAKIMCYIYAGRCLRYQGIISPALGQRLVLAGYSSPAIFKLIKKERFLPGYRQCVALYSAYRQRVGDISSVAAPKLSVSA